eukprot:snap_masked-scaffold_46-processed-gene-1.17-mRNA-1 protein AED:1.00 eAED:1.00 QI:0/0/0/0/1/1/5/0/340
MSNANAALLDSLMGTNRNDISSSKTQRKRQFYDPEVDKNYLCGCSLYEIFKNSKSAMKGENPQIIDEDCKKQWDRLTQKEKDEYGFEYDNWEYLLKHIQKANAKVRLNHESVDKDYHIHCDELAKEVIEIDEKIREQIKMLEDFAESGEIEKSALVFKQIKMSEERRKELFDIPEMEKRRVVCEVSGNLINANDTDERLRATFEGKQYQGWKRVREKIKQYTEQKPPKARVKSRESERRQSNERSRSRWESRSDRDGRNNSRWRDERRSRDRKRSWRDEERRDSRSNKYRRDDKEGRERNWGIWNLQLDHDDLTEVFFLQEQFSNEMSIFFFSFGYDQFK